MADDRGLVWPANIAPYTVYLARLGVEDNVVQAADKLYDELTAEGVEVYYDDRDERPGTKFADADLLGFAARGSQYQTEEQGKFEVAAYGVGIGLGGPRRA